MHSMRHGNPPTGNGLDGLNTFPQGILDCIKSLLDRKNAKCKVKKARVHLRNCGSRSQHPYAGRTISLVEESQEHLIILWVVLFCEQNGSGSNCVGVCGRGGFFFVLLA